MRSKLLDVRSMEWLGFPVEVRNTADRGSSRQYWLATQTTATRGADFVNTVARKDGEHSLTSRSIVGWQRITNLTRHLLPLVLPRESEDSLLEYGSRVELGNAPIDTLSLRVIFGQGNEELQHFLTAQRPSLLQTACSSGAGPPFRVGPETRAARRSADPRR